MYTHPLDRNHDMIHKHSNFAPGIIHSHFTTQGKAPQRQLLEWRDRVSHIVDVPIQRTQLDVGFHATIDRYSVNDLIFTDAFTELQRIERLVARISTDNIRSYAFHVFMGGGIGSVTGPHPQRKAAQSDWGILALDMNQPFRLLRPAGRVLNLFVPRALVEAVLPDADSIHGRVVENTSPLTRMIFDHLATLSQNLPAMSASEADGAMRAGAHTLVAAFGQQARLSGGTRAAARAAIFGLVRRYIDAHLHQAELSPRSLLNALQLPRPTLYRMFEHEGGLGAYIRNRRLREAADELVRFPYMTVMDIAYGLGFKSASDFTRAFRRAYDIAPQDLRAQAFEAQGAEGIRRRMEMAKNNPSSVEPLTVKDLQPCRETRPGRTG